MACFLTQTSYQIGASLVYFFILFFPHIIYANGKFFVKPGYHSGLEVYSQPKAYIICLLLVDCITAVYPKLENIGACQGLWEASHKT